MPRSTLLSWLKWLLKANAVIWAVNAATIIFMLLLGSTLNSLSSYSLLTKMTLLETGIVFLVGGFVAFSGSVLPSKAREQVFKSESEPWSMDKLRGREKKANKFIILALLLFVESFLVSGLGV